MVRRGAGSPKSSFSEIRTLAAGAAGAEIERRVRKTAVLYGGGTTGSNPSSSSGESATNPGSCWISVVISPSIQTRNPVGEGNWLTSAARMQPSGLGNFAGVLTVSHYSTNSATIS
jgi:hypothetical protein